MMAGILITATNRGKTAEDVKKADISSPHPVCNNNNNINNNEDYNFITT